MHAWRCVEHFAKHAILQRKQRTKSIFAKRSLSNQIAVSSLPNNRYIQKEKAKPHLPYANTTQLLKNQSGGGG